MWSNRNGSVFSNAIHFQLHLKKDDYVVQSQRFSPLNRNIFFNCSLKDRCNGIGPHNRPSTLTHMTVEGVFHLRKKFSYSLYYIH